MNILAPFLLVLALINHPAELAEKHVRTLAADDMEGRGLGSKGIARSAAYIEAQLREANLDPAFAGSFRQKFPIRMGVSLGSKNALEGLRTEDWTPLGFSSSGAFSGQVAFVGYGIEAAPLNFRELDGIDLKGKVALMLRYEPQERDEKSPFDGKRPSRWSAMRYKAMQARDRGAVAVIFVTGPLQDEGKEKLPALANDGPESPAGIPVLQLKTSAAQKWIDLAKFQSEVDADLKPRSRLLDLTLSGVVDVQATWAEGENVAAILPGRGSLANESVVIGAHYDHLGFGGRGSMRPNDTGIHNGADDNASGTAAILIAARRLAALTDDSPNRRAIVVALFSAEEVGLGGSSYFVSHSPVPIEQVKAMINLDMVGMLRDDKLVALGSESAAEWKPLLDATGAAIRLTVTSSGDGYGPSDQTSFYARQIPVIHFFTGTHQRYHTPDDDADSINFAGVATTAELTARVAATIARGEVTPVYARASAAPSMQGDSRGYGAYLGTIPDFSAMDGTGGAGVKLADVRAGGPADQAGLRGGDVLVEIASTRIENLHDMTYALQDHKPGETVDVVVLRDGKRMTLRATLGSRRPEVAPGGGGHGAASLEIKAGRPFEKAFEGERHLADIRQLTFGGENAEAYFSPDGRRLIFQRTGERGGCDQQYTLDLTNGETRLVSNGKGRTTCGYFSFPKGDSILYASTEASDPSCPAPPDRKRGYIWGVYPAYEIYVARADGTEKKRITNSPGYDAEATACHAGGKIVFTSVRDGDLDLYEMDESGGNVKRLTNTPGYDGGAFYNRDCTEIVWRASRFTDAAERKGYRELLAEGFVRPSKMELFVARADGSGARQITSNGAANFCPFFTPDGNRIIFASNMLDPRGREFDIFMIGKDGIGEPERVTSAPAFDGFPMFSPDGKFLVFASNRSNPEGRETNLFIAKWVE